MKATATSEIIRIPTRRFVLGFTVAGILVGYALLHPLTMVIYQFEFGPAPDSLPGMVKSAFQRIFVSFNVGMLSMSAAYAASGGVLGFLTGTTLKKLAHKKSLLIIRERMMHQDLSALIRAGESETLEFKQTLRWDTEQQRTNKALELAVVKTLAGFLNTKGGTLLIGISDDGALFGIEQDCSTLKHPDRDGFEQYVIQLMARQCGTDVCPLVHLLFHPIEKHEIARIYVEPAPHPVYVASNSRNFFYIRTGNGTRALEVDEALSYIPSHWN